MDDVGIVKLSYFLTSPRYPLSYLRYSRFIYFEALPTSLFEDSESSLEAVKRVDGILD